ncbi:Zn-ribbon containing protein [Haloarchaeobius amylolyticus]|uniref:Zn-ribbon containing protein n=1 Tax=Haloarchaeobius amylolyticus TaxID=1198296 RepID=A0ABD6BL76_9EURY
MPHQCTNCGRTFADGSKEMLSGCPDCGGNKFQFAPASAAESVGEDDGSESVEPTSGSDSGGITTRATETVREWVSSDTSDTSADAGRGDAELAASSDSRDSGMAPASDRSWPTTDEPTATESDAAADETVTEWPDTARRPEDRTGTVTETSDESDESEPPSQRPDRSTTTFADDENSAQADARSEVVPADDLPAHSDVPSGSDPRDGGDTGDTTAGSTPGDDQPPEHGRVVSEPSGDQPSIEDLRKELNEQFESIKIVRPGQYELNLMELYNRDEYIISLQEDGRYVIDVPDSWRDGDDE